IKKPFELAHVELAVKRAVTHHRLLISKRAHENGLEALVIKRTAELDRAHFYDQLTGLPNRALFSDRLEQVIALADRGQNVAVLLFSLDRFKEARDTYGPVEGNRILSEVAVRLKRCVHPEATLARIEADEFAILLPNCNVNAVTQIAEKICSSLERSIAVPGSEISLSCRIGASVYSHDAIDAENLVKNAGIALGRAKSRASNHVELYTESMHVEALKRLNLESRLRHAVARGELEIFYQPIIATATGQITGCEALVRWNHPELGLLMPNEFIAIAEESGSINEIGEWVLNAACIQVRRWHDYGFQIGLAVNVSVKQFSKTFASAVAGILRETRFDPKYLDLEVTESSLMADPCAAAALLNEIKSLGVRIAIDDFGTGYSSLGYLKKLPIDVLKIDRSFMNDVTTQLADAALVRAIAGLAKNLMLHLVAEGVETEDQLEFLHTIGCEHWQGYLSSMPLPAEKFRELLENGIGRRRVVEIPFPAVTHNQRAVTPSEGTGMFEKHEINIRD
ncbi:MAG: putative bifunctional diguanylate cyclase/phosphodiesterase, partial [Pyrinomonadaceae bacterium]